MQFIGLQLLSSYLTFSVNIPSLGIRGSCLYVIQYAPPESWPYGYMFRLLCNLRISPSSVEAVGLVMLMIISYSLRLFL